MWWRQFVLRQITHWEVGVCVINCRSKTQTKGWRSWRVRRRRRDEGMEGWAEAGGGGRDLQLVELEMLKELPRQGGERILWQVSVGERQTRRKLKRSIGSLFLDICSFLFFVKSHFLNDSFWTSFKSKSNPITKSITLTFCDVLSAFEVKYILGFIAVAGTDISVRAGSPGWRNKG